jgi:alcohol dehydrogenase class IV
MIMLPLPRQQRLVGAGALRRLDEVPEFFQARHMVLVHGRQSFEASGAADVLQDMLAHLQIRRFTSFAPDLALDMLEHALACLAEGPCHAIIAIGGGTCLDLGKLLAACAPNPADGLERIRGGRPLERVGPPVIAVPTTAGSGSEATHFATLRINGHKRLVVHPGLLPAAAIVDCQLTSSLPPRQTALSGLDALVQAVESYWSVYSTRQTKRWARRAIQLIVRHFVAAVHDPQPEDRAAMADAAHLAGRAINATGGGACTALAHALTARLGLPHGLAAALAMGPVYRYNHEVASADAADRRGAAFVRRTMRELDRALDTGGDGEGGGNHGQRCVRELLAAASLPSCIAEAGAPPADCGFLSAALEGSDGLARTNPRSLTVERMAGLLYCS